MERDFLGISGKDSGGLVKEESRGTQKDSAFIGNSAVQWPFSSKFAAIHSMKKAAFDHVSSSGFQPIPAKNPSEACLGASSVKESPQRCFGFDRQNVHQFSMHPSFSASTGTPLLDLHGSSNNPVLMGLNSRAFTPRHVSKLTTSSQLTIFYGGSVNVYDDVPLEKAEAIMVLASKSCNASTSNTQNQGPDINPVSALISKATWVNNMNANHIIAQRPTQNPTHVPNQITVNSHLGAQTRSSSSTTDDVAAAKNVAALPATLSRHEPSEAMNTSASVVGRAVPQARKASLTRFLEKRKERVTSAVPYSCAKTSPENSSGFDGANISSKCSSADLSLSSSNAPSQGRS